MNIFDSVTSRFSGPEEIDPDSIDGGYEEEEENTDDILDEDDEDEHVEIPDNLADEVSTDLPSE